MVREQWRQLTDLRLHLGMEGQEVRPGGCRQNGRLGKSRRVERRPKRGGAGRNSGGRRAEGQRIEAREEVHRKAQQPDDPGVAVK